MPSTWSNWSGLETAEPARVVTPRSAEEVAAEIVRAREAGSTVKMAGTGHSFTGIANPDRGTHLLPHAMSGIVAIDHDAMTVTARSGTQLKAMNIAAEHAGLSLHNMGDIAEQTIAGATQTGTHGTGGFVAGLAPQLAGFEIVTGTGEVLQCSTTSNPDVFELGRVSLGALGIMTSLTFKVEPLFALEAVEQPMGWDEFVGSFDEMTADAHHVDAYWFPHTDRLSTKRNSRLASLDEAEPLPGWKAWLDDELLQNTAFGLECALAHRVPSIIPRMNQLNARVLSARTYSDVAHKVFTTPRTVVFREMEYAVPREEGLSVLAECRKAFEASGLRVSFPVEIRVAPADDVPMSTGFERDAFYLAFHTYRDDDHLAYFALMEPILKAHGGRPHWGKVHTRTADDLRPVYRRFDDFLALRDRLDPDRVFANPYLRRVLGD